MAATDVQWTAPSRSSLFRWIAGILIGIALTLAIIGITAWTLTGLGVYELARTFRGRQTRIAVDQPTVVRQVRALQRLETVSYSTEKILTGERENPVLPQFLAGDRLLLIAHGEVVAGVDLSKLQPDDVQVRGSSVSIRLPATEIFTTSLDNAKTRVYERDTGLFSTPDPDLEGEVREEAEHQLRAGALDDGILKTAESNAAQTIRTMLTSLGFTSVELSYDTNLGRS